MPVYDESFHKCAIVLYVVKNVLESITTITSVSVKENWKKSYEKQPKWLQSPAPKCLLLRFRLAAWMHFMAVHRIFYGIYQMAGTNSILCDWFQPLNHRIIIWPLILASLLHSRSHPFDVCAWARKSFPFTIH